MKRYIEGVVSRAKVLSVGKRNDASEYAKLGLRSNVPKPLMRTERGRGIGDLANIKKWAEFQGRQSISIYVLVSFP